MHVAIVASGECQARPEMLVLTRVAGVAAALERLLHAQKILLTLAARVAEVLPPACHRQQPILALLRAACACQTVC